MDSDEGRGEGEQDGVEAKVREVEAVIGIE